jgi:hypothetical protein
MSLPSISTTPYFREVPTSQPQYFPKVIEVRSRPSILTTPAGQGRGYVIPVSGQPPLGEGSGAADYTSRCPAQPMNAK